VGICAGLPPVDGTSAGGAAVAPDRTIKVVIADDDPTTTRRLIGLMQAADDVVVVGEASERDAVLELTDRRPDVVVLDLTDPPERLSWTRAIAARDDSVNVIVVMDADGADRSGETFRAGARGLVARTAPAEQLVQAVRMVAGGNRVIDATTWQASSSMPARRHAEPMVYVTKRELDVLRLLAAGWTNKRIGEELGIAGETVKSYLDRIFRRLGVDNRTDAVAKAMRAGLID
jgi:two-component system, NarL family, response regulator DevR